MKVNRFNEILKLIPEITHSLLAKRLTQLQTLGYVRKKTLKNPSHNIVWEMTEKGMDTIPIIIALIGHSAKWRANDLFEDKSPRNLREIFPHL
jgi:DNA-binding HxlR family transcriptional regulator